MGRHHGMDWLRIGAFALLILYHIGMFFVPWDWHVKTADPQHWLRVPMMATNAWRIPLLFVVSGYASAALLARESGGRFLGSRTARLMVPLIFAMIVIIPPQPWVELTYKYAYAKPYPTFWTGDYFGFEKLHGIDVPTWQHLWFVVYLWVYSMAFGLLAIAVPAGASASLARGIDRLLAGPGLLIVPIAALLVHWAIWPDHESTHALFDDGPSHLIYFGLFLFGAYLRGPAERGWAAIRRWWPLAAALSIMGYIVVSISVLRTGATDLSYPIARVVQMWGAIVALIGIADRFWNRDHRWRPMLTEAVFPFYIIHQTIIVVVGWWLLRFGIGPAAEFAIILPATVIGCWAFYLIGRELKWLRPLIGLRMARPRPSARGG